jgi:hypothetical protein
MKLDHYYQETDRSSVYSTAVILDPRLKLCFFQRKWTEHPDWIEVARKSTERRYQEYLNNDSVTASVMDNQTTDILDAFKFGKISQQDIKDELADCLSFPLAAQNVDPVKWWIDHVARFPFFPVWLLIFWQFRQLLQKLNVLLVGTLQGR